MSLYKYKLDKFIDIIRSKFKGTISILKHAYMVKNESILIQY